MREFFDYAEAIALARNRRNGQEDVGQAVRSQSETGVSHPHNLQEVKEAISSMSPTPGKERFLIDATLNSGELNTFISKIAQEKGINIGVTVEPDRGALYLCVCFIARS